MIKKIVIIFIILLVALILFSIIRTGFVSKQQKITIVFRYDDYSSASSTQFETKLISTFQKYNIPFTIGIIPYITSEDVHSPNPSPQKVIPLSEKKAYILKTAMDSGIVEPALHGYCHQTIRDYQKSGGYTEFSGLDYKKQMKKIMEGKKLLEDMLNTKIITFIPPWSTYDTNTLRCLEELNFNCISSSSFGPILKEDSRLKSLPENCSISKLRQTIDSARHSSYPTIIVVLLHSYTFDETRGEITYQDFSKLLSWLTSQKDIHVSTIGQLAQRGSFRECWKTFINFLLRRAK